MPNLRLWLCTLTAIAGLGGLIPPAPAAAADRLVAAFYCPAVDLPFVGDLLTPIVSVLEDQRVRAEVGLSADQAERLAAVEAEYNAGVKGLLAGGDERSRELTKAGAPPDGLVQAVGKMSEDSHRKTNEILDRTQTQRLQEIVLQRYGVLFVPKRELRQILGLSREQERGIDEIKSRIFAGISETAAPGEAVVAANRCAFATLGGPRIGALLRDGEQAARRLLSSEQARTVERFAGKPFAP